MFHFQVAKCARTTSRKKEKTLKNFVSLTSAVDQTVSLKLFVKFVEIFVVGSNFFFVEDLSFKRLKDLS